MRIVRCAKCGEDVDPTEKYWVCDNEVIHDRCVPASWAEDNDVEAAAPAIERSK